MRAIAKVLRRVRTWMRPRQFRRELDEELCFHLEMQTRWYESQGFDQATARAVALREFGGEARFREAVLDARGFTWAHDLGRDVRFALRSYRRNPAFTAVALVTLVLGIALAWDTAHAGRTTLCVMGAVLIGGLIGEAIGIERRL